MAMDQAGDLMLLADSQRSAVVAMINAKESFNLQRCLGCIDRAKRSFVSGIETDQKLILARFEAMIRHSRTKQVGLMVRDRPM